MKSPKFEAQRWDAQGNIYLVAEGEALTPERVRDEVGDADGILEVLTAGDDWDEIAIWNPDGSRAEISGNGTRIAARWLADRTHADRVVVRVGGLEVPAVLESNGMVEQDMGVVSVGGPEEVEGIRLVSVDVG